MHLKYANAFPLPPYQIKSAIFFSEDLGGEFIPDTSDISKSCEGSIESNMDMGGEKDTLPFPGCSLETSGKSLLMEAYVKLPIIP